MSNSTFFETAQRFGKSFMLPIAVLPAAGLLLGIGGALSNPNTLIAYPFLDIPFLQAILTVMTASGAIVFSNLPVLFAVGVAVGLAKGDKGTVGIAALLAYLVMNATIGAMLSIQGSLATSNLSSVGQGMLLGIQTLDTGVFGGVIVGIMANFLHGRYNKIELPKFLGFFGGSRFVPIVSAFSAMILGALMFALWPIIQSGIFGMGSLIETTGYIGTFIYGFTLRMLGLFGLHHIFYLPFWTTALGGSEVVNGVMVEGTQRIFFAQLADPTVQHFFIGTSRFMSGRFITMMFGLMGAALAIYHCAKPEHKVRVGGLMLFGVLQGQAKTNWIAVPIIGTVWFFLYYFTFRFLITKMNLKTLGREDELQPESSEISGTDRATAIVQYLGHATNIKDVDCCATRLRLTLNDATKVDQAGLKSTGAIAVVMKGNGVQVIYGPHVTIVKNELEELLNL
ncbi:MAG: PTS transporter subunit EIIC [Vibrio hibernica]